MTQEVVEKKSEEKLANGTDKNAKPEEKARERRDATPTKVGEDILHTAPNIACQY